MGKFDIGNFAASLSETVSKLDTSAKPQLQYIDIDQLDAHNANFYDVSNLDTLADSIAMDGLQQPLVVTAGEGGRYTVLSGHRRRAALRKLVEEDGREDLRRVPCLVRVYQSQALAELQLIMANSTARVLTSAEVMHQAKRMEELLYQLKEEGYSFPGRMRDQVAEACQVSASKLARLKMIRDKLIDPWMDRFEAGEISEDVAYTIAQMGRDYQESLDTVFGLQHAPSITAPSVKAWSERLQEIASIECVQGSACTNRERMIQAQAKTGTPYWQKCKSCCASCSSRSICGLCCPLVEEQLEQEAEARRQELEKSKAEMEEQAAKRAAKEVAEAECNRKRWQRLGREFDRIGITREEAADMWHLEGPDQRCTLQQLLDGERPEEMRGMEWDLEEELADCEMFSTLAEAGVSLDYVLTGVQVGMGWCTGSPVNNGFYFCIKSGKNGAWLHWWQDDHWEMAEAILPVQISVDLWTPAPIIPTRRAWEREEV